MILLINPNIFNIFFFYNVLYLVNNYYYMFIINQLVEIKFNLKYKDLQIIN